jgi:hypothetical protein
VRTRAGAAVFYADTEGARSADLGILLGADTHSRVERWDGDGEFARMCYECTYILPAPSLAVSRSPSLSFSVKLVGSLFSARFDVCPASHPYPHTHDHRAHGDK